MPYLLTGDRYYAEEMAFWANYSMLRTYNGDGVRSSQGILKYNEVQGFGWALRNIVDAAAYYPDASPMKAYLSQKVTNNLGWLDAYANSQDPITNPFTVLWVGLRQEGPQYRALWEENFLAYAIDRAFQQGFSRRPGASRCDREVPGAVVQQRTGVSAAASGAQRRRRRHAVGKRLPLPSDDERDLERDTEPDAAVRWKPRARSPTEPDDRH